MRLAVVLYALMETGCFVTNRTLVMKPGERRIETNGWGGWGVMRAADGGYVPSDSNRARYHLSNPAPGRPLIVTPLGRCFHKIHAYDCHLMFTERFGPQPISR